MTLTRHCTALISLLVLLTSLNLSVAEEISAKPAATPAIEHSPASPEQPPAPQVGPPEHSNQSALNEATTAQAALPPTEAEYWAERVDTLIIKWNQGKEVKRNTLYLKLSKAFDLNADLYQASSWKQQPAAQMANDNTVSYTRPQTQDQLFTTIDTLYHQRLRLMNTISEQLKSEVTGTGVEGVEEFKRELDFLTITLHYRLHALPDLLDTLVNDLTVAPLPTLWQFMQLILAIMAFRFWQRWAPKGLHKIRASLMKARPRTQRNLRMTKFIWYFDQVRSPIAWLLLLSLLFSFAEQPALLFFIEVARITMRWILLSWLGVLLINAWIARSSNSLNVDTSGITLRSLQYLGTWLVINGLTLDLIRDYAGEGTLYAWALLTNEVLLLLLLIILLILWRPIILQACENEPQQNFITSIVRQQRRGITGYFYSIIGAAYILKINISKKFMDWISNFNTGQQVLDSLLGLEMARAYQQQKKDPDAQPLPPELEQKILSTGDKLIEMVGNSHLKKIIHRIETGIGGNVIVTGETGGGKSVLLQRVSKGTDKKSIMVSCPKEGYDALIKELARKLHIDKEQPTAQSICQEIKKKDIEVMIIDDIHRIIRPCFGGQQDLNQLAEIFNHTPGLLWILSLNTATWQYITRARARRLFDKSTMQLPPWSVEQISTLIKTSCQNADIEPDFSKVVIPRQYDNSNYDDPGDRVFSGFIRIIHGSSMGNPKVAIGLWAKSLYLNKRDQVIVQLPELPSSDDLDNASLTVLLVLRVICQAEVVQLSDIINSLQLTREEIVGALQLTLLNKWVEVLDDEYYELNWYWRRIITRVLARQNLMPRSV